LVYRRRGLTPLDSETLESICICWTLNGLRVIQIAVHTWPDPRII
jgi:hypothetical protein